MRGIHEKQEVTDDLHVCVLNVLPEVTTLPSLVVVSFVKLEIYFYQIVK